MPTIEEVTNTLRHFDDETYNVAVQFIFSLADTHKKSSGKADSEKRKKLKAAASMHQYSNPELIDQEKSAWKRAVVKKYE